MSGNVTTGMDCGNGELGRFSKELSECKSEWRCQMILLKRRVFSVALLLAVSAMMLSGVKAQNQPMNEIPLGGGGAGAKGTAGGALLDGGDLGAPPAATATTGPEATAFDGTYVWIATQFNDSVTRVKATDGLVSGTFTVGKRPVALLYAASAIWVANLLSDNVTKLDPATGAILGTYAAGDGPGG